MKKTFIIALFSIFLSVFLFGCKVKTPSVEITLTSEYTSVPSIYAGVVNNLTLSLAKELGPSNITVNAICPGLIDTKMNSNLSTETIKNIVEETPLNKVGTPKDVANLVEFLLSDKANFITGQIITIDGGFSL